MPHIKPLEDDQACDKAKPIFDNIQSDFGSVPNFYRTMGHNPTVLEAFLQKYISIHQDLPDKFRELAYLKSSLVNNCSYCTHYHQQLGKQAGLTEEQIAAAEDFSDSEHFDDQEKAVLRFAEQLTRLAHVDDAVTNELMDFLSSSQMVVLAATVGVANFTNRFNNALGIELP